MILAACVVMVVGLWLLIVAIRAGRESREAWQAWDMVYPATWTQDAIDGCWRVTICIPPDHSKPDVTIELQDDVIRTIQEMG